MSKFWTYLITLIYVSQDLYSTRCGALSILCVHFLCGDVFCKKVSLFCGETIARHGFLDSSVFLRRHI